MEESTHAALKQDVYFQLNPTFLIASTLERVEEVCNRGVCTICLTTCEVELIQGPQDVAGMEERAVIEEDASWHLFITMMYDVVQLIHQSIAVEVCKISFTVK